MNIKAAALALTLLPATAMAQPAPVGPPCTPPPEGSDKDTQICYAFACISFRAAWNACDTSFCKVEAYVQYLDDLYWCTHGIASIPEGVGVLEAIAWGESPFDPSPISLPIYAIGSSSPFVLSLNLTPADTEPVPEGVIVLSDGTWYEPTAQN